MIKLFRLILVAFFSLLFLLPAAAVEDGHAGKVRNSQKNTARYVNGTIVSTSFADANLGTKSEIDISDSKGNSSSYIITDTTTMYDNKGNSITMERLTKGESIKIKYIVTKSGIKEAQLIKITGN
jgi:hypothetical protein